MMGSTRKRLGDDSWRAGRRMKAGWRRCPASVGCTTDITGKRLPEKTEALLSQVETRS